MGRHFSTILKNVEKYLFSTVYRMRWIQHCTIYCNPPLAKYATISKFSSVFLSTLWSIFVPLATKETKRDFTGWFAHWKKWRLKSRDTAAKLALDKNLFLVLFMGSFDGLFCWLILSIYVISMMEINGICIQGLTRVRHGVLSTTLYKNKMECKYYSTKFLL